MNELKKITIPITELNQLHREQDAASLLRLRLAFLTGLFRGSRAAQEIQEALDEHTAGKTAGSVSQPLLDMPFELVEPHVMSDADMILFELERWQDQARRDSLAESQREALQEDNNISEQANLRAEGMS